MRRDLNLDLSVVLVTVVPMVQAALRLALAGVVVMPHSHAAQGHLYSWISPGSPLLDVPGLIPKPPSSCRAVAPNHEDFLPYPRVRSIH